MFLAGAIVFELAGTTCLKLSDALSNIPFTICFAIAYTITFALFTKALEVLPLGLSYGIWGGLGTIGTVIIGMVVWNDPMTPFIALGIGLVITGTFLMNSGTNDEDFNTAE